MPLCGVWGGGGGGGGGTEKSAQSMPHDLGFSVVVGALSNAGNE